MLIFKKYGLFLFIILLFFSCNRTPRNELQSDEIDIVFIEENNYLYTENNIIYLTIQINNFFIH
jgi:hypothetical protein